MDIYSFLDQNKIAFERCDHSPVYTCEEAKRLVPELPGAKTKNLFLRNKKGDRHFLVSVGHEKSVDLKALSSCLGCGKLSFGSSERLMKHLELEPGSVSLLAVINDDKGRVEVVIDKALWNNAALQCHPLVNSSTLVLAREDLERFFELTNHKVQVLEVPAVP